jgi:hypothetical protein
LLSHALRYNFSSTCKSSLVKKLNCKKVNL